jgi:nitroreductase
MDALDAIFTRRSIRKYADKKVSEETIQKLISAGMSAPTARNLRPWHFLAITERKILDDIPKIHPYSQMLKEAPLAILVCGDKTINPEVGYIVEDCSAATQNILLAAHALGLGGVWLGVWPKDERVKPIEKMFSLPENIVPVALISIGYPNENKDAPDRYEPAKVHKNRW